MPYVFIYGPDSVQGRVYDRLGASEVLGGAVLEGYALRFNKPSFKTEDGLANVVREPGQSVFGVLYDLTRKQIDMLEGYYGGYQREQLKVLPLPRETREGEEKSPLPTGPIDATIYLARRVKDGLKPTKENLALTVKGAEENGAPGTFLESLKHLEAE